MTRETLKQTLTQHVAQHHFGVFFIRGFEVRTYPGCPRSPVASACAEVWISLLSERQIGSVA